LYGIRLRSGGRHYSVTGKMIQKYTEILNIHQQQRKGSCFQMAPELALKFAGILPRNKYPFQDNHDWDWKGYEPYADHLIVGRHELVIQQELFKSPYSDMAERLNDALAKNCFPVVSLQSPGSDIWHGYVVIKELTNDNFVVVTKGGSLEELSCVSIQDELKNRTLGSQNVDCLFWKIIATT